MRLAYLNKDQIVESRVPSRQHFGEMQRAVWYTVRHDEEWHSTACFRFTGTGGFSLFSPSPSALMPLPASLASANEMKRCIECRASNHGCQVFGTLSYAMACRCEEKLRGYTEHGSMREWHNCHSKGDQRIAQSRPWF